MILLYVSCGTASLSSCRWRLSYPTQIFLDMRIYGSPKEPLDSLVPVWIQIFSVGSVLAPMHQKHRRVIVCEELIPNTSVKYVIPPTARIT